jgi:hypothetical protein
LYADIGTLRPVSSRVINKDLIPREQGLPVYSRAGRQDELFVSILKRLEREMPRDTQSREILGKELDNLSTILRGISESLQGKSYRNAGLLAVESIKNNIPGITSNQINKWIAECFPVDPSFHAGYIAIEAFKKNYQGIDMDYVKRSIEGCFKNDFSSVAGTMAIAALKAKIPGVLPDDIHKSIDMCFKKNEIKFASQLIIDAMQEDAADINGNDIKNWIEMSFDRGFPLDAGLIAVEAEKNNVLGDFWPCIKRSIQVCSDKRLRISPMRLIVYILANQMGNITAEEVGAAVKACRAKGLSYEAGMIAIEAFINDIPGITPDSIKDIIEHSFFIGDPKTAGLVAIEAIKRNVPGVTDGYVSKSVYECFQNNKYDDGGLIAIEAVKNGISSVSINDIRTGVSETLYAGFTYQAGYLLSEAVNGNVPGITAHELKEVIAKCFAERNSYAALPIIKSILCKRFPGISDDYISECISECYIFDNPYNAGCIALEALKNNMFGKKINKIISVLNDMPQARDSRISYFICSGLSYALKNNKTDCLDIVLSVADEKLHFIRALTRLMDVLGPGAVWGDIFAQRGLGKFRGMHNMLYGYIFRDILPDSLDIRQKSTNILLRAITKFDISNFSRHGQKGFEEIYYDFRKAWCAGGIKPLPPGIPKPAIIEVSTDISRSFSGLAKQYYKDIIDAAHDAISIMENMDDPDSPYAGIVGSLIGFIDDEIDMLSVKARGKVINSFVLSYINQRLDLFNKARQNLMLYQSSHVMPLLFLEGPELNALSDIKFARMMFRQALFMAAFYDNAEWKRYFSILDSSVLTPEKAVRLVEFVDDFLKLDLLSDIDYEAKKALLKHLNPATFKDKMARLADKRSCFKKRIGIYPCRGWLAEYIGYYCDECWVATPDIIRDNPDMIPLVFVDEDYGEIVGGTLLMPNYINGVKVLIDRGLSPRLEFTRNIDVGDFVEKVLDYEEKIAVSMGASKIVVPLRMYEEGLGTNNPDIIQYYERSIEDKSPVDLDEMNRFNRHSIAQGRCAVIRDLFKGKNTHSPAVVKDVISVFKIVDNAA